MNLLKRYGLALLVKVTPLWEPLRTYQVVVTDPDAEYAVPLHADNGEVWEASVRAEVFRMADPGENLVDGRRAVVPIHPQASDGRQWFETCMVPSTRTLAEILTDVVSHGTTHPSHGTGCACMDDFVREVRVHVLRPVPEHWTAPVTNDSEAMMNLAGWRNTYEAKARISYVLGLVVRNL